MARPALSETGQGIQGIYGADWFFGPHAPQGTSRYEGNADALPRARELEFDGAVVRLGFTPDGGLKLSDPAQLGLYRRRARQTGMSVPILSLDDKVSPASNDPAVREQALRSMGEAVGIAHRLVDIGVQSIRVPFFGLNEINAVNMEGVVETVGLAAEQAGNAPFVFELETALPAHEEVALLDRIGMPNVVIAFDTGNAYKAEQDIDTSIRELADAGVLYTIDLKDNTARKNQNGEHKLDPQYLDSGRIVFPDVARTLAEVGFSGPVVLETLSPRHFLPGPPGSTEGLEIITEDLIRNRKFVRDELFADYPAAYVA